MVTKKDMRAIAGEAVRLHFEICAECEANYKPKRQHVKGGKPVPHKGLLNMNNPCPLGAEILAKWKALRRPPEHHKKAA